MHGKSVDGSRDWLVPEPHPRESERRKAVLRKPGHPKTRVWMKGQKHDSFFSLFSYLSGIRVLSSLHSSWCAECLHTSTGVLSYRRCHLLVQSGDSSLNVRCLTASRPKVAVRNTPNHLFILSPLTHSYGPGSDDPQGDTEDQKHSSRADGHQSLHHKPCVKVHLKRKTTTSV